MLKTFATLAIFGLIQSQSANAGFINTLVSSVENEVSSLREYKNDIEAAMEFTKALKPTPNPEEEELRAKLNNQPMNRCTIQALTTLEVVAPVKCPNLDDLIGKSGDLIVNTTQIITGIIHEFYVILIDNPDCTGINAFRCFLKKFHEFGTTLVKVGAKVAGYKENTMQVVETYRLFFHCKANKTQALAQIEDEHKLCTQNMRLY